MRAWKLIGLAGLTGVATTAVVVALRKRRTWTERDPAELRALLHARLAESEPAPATCVSERSMGGDSS